MSRSLFSVFGVELEYMIVDAETFGVVPKAPDLLGPEGDVGRGEVTWSNELVAHVVEFKCTEPAATLADLEHTFARNVGEVNSRLAAYGCRLLPGGMHPWMNPHTETTLWPGSSSEVYATFDRLFGCRGHGWANLQSSHLNLPFANDAEFGRLHAAIRLVLPLIPALAAASPYYGGRFSGLLDARLAVYRTNSARFPAVAGQIVPEAVFTAEDYAREILGRIYADLAAEDPQGVLRHEWANARGAIARFSRGSIEIRIVDNQECPRADLAILRAIVAVLRGLTHETWQTFGDQKTHTTTALALLFEATIRDGELALITESSYLAAFGLHHPTTAGDLWRHALARLGHPLEPALARILDEGPLARRLVRALGTQPSADQFHAITGQLADCLASGQLFEPA